MLKKKPNASDSESKFGEGMVSPNDGRTGPNDKGAKMQTSLAAAPRVRSSEEHSKLKLPFPPTNNGLMMEVWASVASWFFRPDAAHSPFPPAPLAANLPNVRGGSPRLSNTRPSGEHGRHLAMAPAICTAIRCTVPGCSCDCFTPRKMHIRVCETCSHGWVPHALDKLGFKHLYDQSQVEPVQPNVAFDIASLVLYGTQALPIRLKILLDRLFSVLQREEVLQVLHGFGWTQEDYARGYILQEPHGNVLERWNICSPEEEPLVLQQFLRFGETRAITQQLLLAQADQAAALASSLCGERDQDRDRDRSYMDRDKEREAERDRENRERDRDRDRDRERHLQFQHQLKIESDLKKAIEKSGLKPPKLEMAPSLEERSKSHRENRSRTRTVSPTKRLSPPHSQHAATTHSTPPMTRPSPAPPSPLYKQSPLNLLKLPAQNGPNCSGSSPPTSVNSSPLSVSPLNRLQSMQPFDFRKVSGSSPFSSSDSGRRRASENADTSPSVNVTSPTWHLPPPLPPPSSATSVTPVNLSHSALSTNPLSAVNLVASSFPNLIPAAGRTESKSPSIKAEKGGNSEFGSEEDEEDEENSHSALNLSRDSANKPMKKPNHQRKGVSPIKRSWGTSSALPLNLGTQLINPATGKKRVQCNVCLKTFCDKGALKIHFSAVHLREMHKCTVEGCNMMFSSRRSRNRHSANPNPKLHSPHLRRKISPHDGRSSQSHPILIPPHGALSLPGGGLNPLSFGAFPLLTPPPELRHQASALDLKQSLDLTLNKFDERKAEFSSSTNQSSDDGVAANANSQYDDMDDDEDYEGIVVVGDDEQDQDIEEHTEKNQDDELTAKRVKLAISDIDDVGSNVDSNEDSLSVMDNHNLKEETATEGNITGEAVRPRGRKRKNQNPTRCAIPVRTSQDDGMSTDGEGSREPENLYGSKKDENGSRAEVSEKLVKKEEDKKEDFWKRDEEDDGEAKAESSSKINAKEDKQTEREETSVEEKLKKVKSPSSDQDSDSVNPLNHLESFAQSRFEDERMVEGNGYYVSTGLSTCSGHLSPSKSHSSTQSNGPESPEDENNEGCNIAIPSKRNKDRHGSNLNLHRKLLSTTSDKLANIWDKGPFSANAAFHGDFLSRLYSESQSIPLGYDAYKNHPHLLPDGLLNGERVLAGGHMPFSSLAFPNIGFPSSHSFLPNGLDRRDRGSGSASPGSPPINSSPSGLSVELDMPTPDREGLLPCKYCKKVFPDGGSLKEHYEQTHVSELFKCSVEGCDKAFISRSKRNGHCERHSEAVAANWRGSTSAAEYGS